MGKIIRFYIYGQWHIALCAALLYAGGCLINAQPIHQATFLLIFFATLFIYNLHRLLSAKKMQTGVNDRYQFMMRHSVFTQSLLILYALIAFTLFFFISRSAQLALIISGVISLGYILPLVFKKRLRDLGNGKIVLISIVWAILPILGNFNYSDGLGNSLLFIEHFLFIFALTIPFDVRDQDLDKKAKVSNLANKLGVSKLKKLMYGSLVLTVSIVFVLHMFDIYTLQLFLVIMLFYFLLFMSIRKLSQQQPEWYYLFYLDGLIGVKGLIYFLCI